MANKNISGLTAATTPLVGTELVPIWDGTGTKKVSVDNLTTGKPVVATHFTASTGNFVPATSGKGIDFSAHSSAPGATSKVLVDYEEGTWTVAATPSTSGSITTYAGYNVGSYTKVGRLVTVSGFIYVQSVSAPVGALTITGLPFPIIGGDPVGRGAGAVSAVGLAAGATTSLQLKYYSGDNKLYVVKYAAGSVSNLAGDVQANAEISFTVTYPTSS